MSVIKRLVLVAIILISGLVHGQEESRSWWVHLGAGYETYQLIPVGFSAQGSTVASHRVLNSRFSPAFTVNVNSEIPDSRLKVGVLLSYQRTLSDLRADTLIITDSYTVSHVTLMASLTWTYWENETFALIGGALVGGGFDHGTFTEEIPDFEYTDWDYHYQLEPIGFRWGNQYGLEVRGGYGALGYVRGSFFLQL